MWIQSESYAQYIHTKLWNIILTPPGLLRHESQHFLLVSYMTHDRILWNGIDENFTNSSGKFFHQIPYSIKKLENRWQLHHLWKSRIRVKLTTMKNYRNLHTKRSWEISQNLIINFFLSSILQFIRKIFQQMTSFCFLILWLIQICTHYFKIPPKNAAFTERCRRNEYEQVLQIFIGQYKWTHNSRIISYLKCGISKVDQIIFEYDHSSRHFSHIKNETHFNLRSHHFTSVVNNFFLLSTS